MLILIYGEDTFRSRKKLNELEEAYRKKHKDGFSFERINAQDVGFSELKNAIQGLSLFDDNKMVVLEDLKNNKALKENFAAWEGLENFSKDKNSLLIIVEEGGLEKDKGYEFIFKNANKKQEFKKPLVGEAVKWFEECFKKENKNLAPSIIKKVVEASAVNVPKKGLFADMWQAYNDLNKLYSYNQAKVFTEKEASLLAIGSEEAQIFPTIDAIFSGNTDKAFYGIQTHWQDNYAPQQLFSMIERQTRIIAIIKEEKERGFAQKDIAASTGLHPFVVKKTEALSAKFSWNKLDNIYNRLESLDIRSKTGQIDPRLACELLSAAIAS